MTKLIKTTSSAILILIALTLNFNGTLNKKHFEESHRDTRACLMKYLYFFPVKAQKVSIEKEYKTNLFHLTPNFSKFCYCQNESRYDYLEGEHAMSAFARIDNCSNLYLSHFEHHQQYELNLKLMIEPLVLELVEDNLKFFKPIVSSDSFNATLACMQSRILKNCTKHSSLSITNKCIQHFLMDHSLYQQIYRKCHNLEFRPSKRNDVMKI